MRILLCDDHLLLVESITAVFEGLGHRVVPALHPEQAVQSLTGRVPDVCVLDLGFPKHDFGNPVALVRRAAPAMPIVVFTGTSDQTALAEARGAGAQAWVSKDDSVARLVEVVERVAHDPEAGEWTWKPRSVAPCAGERSPYFLTTRERQALEGLVLGKNTTELARWMGVRESTVSTHIQTVLTKLGVHSRLEAVAYAMATRLVAVLPPEVESACR